MIRTVLVNFSETPAPTLTGFGGSEDATVVNDPTDATNKVARVVKSATAEVWAGATVSICANQAVPTLPFTTTLTTLTARVWSPAAGVPVRMKVENASDPSKSVETEATTTAASTWQTLNFNFANPVAGTAAFNAATTYNKVSVFFNFGTGGAATGARTYFLDDLAFRGSSFTPACPATVSYTHLDVYKRQPYAWLRVTRGDLRVRLPAAGQRLHAEADPRALALKVGGKAYALFGPTGVKWEPVSPTEWIARLPAGAGYLSVAGLPDDQAETLTLFTRHAYAFIKQTRVEWRYDEAASQVETTFRATTQVMEGPDNGPLLGLYPHQWFRNASVEGKLGATFATVRGKLRMLPASEFKTTYRYNGFVPYWPAVTGSPRQAELKDVMEKDFATAGRELQRQSRSFYWAGKGLQRTLKLAEVFEQQGDLASRDRLLDLSLIHI